MEPLRADDPRQMGPYQLTGRLDSGGMGQVFLGRSRGGRPVAVKVVRPEFADNARFRRRFATEVKAAQRVGGFYTAQVVDADIDADPPWLVTAFIPGPSLFDAVAAHGPLPPAAVGALGAGLAEGLAAIHACDLVHRDLKPANVILAADGPRVIDFGIARALDAASHTSGRVGTPSFMSPEQVRGDQIGPPSDVFALGAVLVFAATGRRPFGTGPAHAITHRILHDEPDLTGLSPELADLVGACLIKAPENRPGLTDLLDRLTAPAKDATRWLPPEITAMITRIEQSLQPSTEPSQVPSPTSGDAEAVGSEGDGGGFDFGWVVTCSADELVNRIQFMRAGEQPSAEVGGELYPANAIHALHIFARRRPIDELVEFTESFDRRDANTILTVAALRREVEEAAELAFKQWDAERRRAESGTPLTDVIIHDLACQRTVPDVAAFVRECRQAGRHELTEKTLDEFARINSGRKNDDKAQLYITLRDNDCNDEATELLHKTLTAIEASKRDSTSTRDSGATPAKLYEDLLGALQHHSPAGRILEDWIDARLLKPGANRHPRLVSETTSIVADLLADRTDDPDTVAEHVGTRLKSSDIVEICSRLPKESPKCAEVRKHAASRGNDDELAQIVIDWHRHQALTHTTEDLLAEIVAAGPRSLEELTDLSERLRFLTRTDADANCRRLLWIAAATHTGGRSGSELVTLLSNVERPRDRRHVMLEIARNLTADVLKNDRDVARFVEYIKELRRARSAGAVYLALKELADPAPSSGRAGEGAGKVIAEIAAGLYDEVPEHNDGWDLLERFLENEQRTTSRHVADIVARLRRTSSMKNGDRLLLLRTTVGPWSDTNRREKVVAELRGRGFHDEADQVIRSIR